MAIKAILLIPTEGDPHGLLKEGPCGARPPFAVRGVDMKTLSYEWRAGPSGGLRGSNPRALILAWDGKPVREGCDRADWGDSWEAAPNYPVRDIWATVFALMDHPEDTHVTVDDLRRLCVELGTVALLDADRKEIK